MNKHRTIRLGVLIVVGIGLSCFTKSVLSETAADKPITAKIIASRHRVEPGGVVEFKFALINAEGKPHAIPRSRSSSGSNPKLALYDSQGEEIGIYNFRFG